MDQGRGSVAAPGGLATSGGGIVDAAGGEGGGGGGRGGDNFLVAGVTPHAASCRKQ